MLAKPKENEIPTYYVHMVNQIDDDLNILIALENQASEIEQFFNSIPSDKLEYRYSENKWTPKQILNHFTDMERVFAYRALCFSRGDQQSLPGAEENQYADEIKANQFTLDELLADFKAVRSSTLTLFNMIRGDVWSNNGSANGIIIPLRAIPFFIYGHAKHHTKIIKERYL